MFSESSGISSSSSSSTTGFPARLPPGYSDVTKDSPRSDGIPEGDLPRLPLQVQVPLPKQPKWEPVSGFCNTFLSRCNVSSIECVVPLLLLSLRLKTDGLCSRALLNKGPSSPRACPPWNWTPAPPCPSHHRRAAPSMEQAPSHHPLNQAVIWPVSPPSKSGWVSSSTG